MPGHSQCRASVSALRGPPVWLLVDRWRRMSGSGWLPISPLGSGLQGLLIFAHRAMSESVAHLPGRVPGGACIRLEFPPARPGGILFRLESRQLEEMASVLLW